MLVLRDRARIDAKLRRAGLRSILHRIRPSVPVKVKSTRDPELRPRRCAIPSQLELFCRKTHGAESMCDGSPKFRI